MLGRELTDLELVEFDAGISTLTPAELLAGLRARVRRLEMEHARARDQSRHCRASAVEEAQRRGGPYLFNRWRDWSGTPFDSGEVTAAIVEALTQEGISAWNGDGVSLVTQMVEAGHARAVKAELERDEALGKLDAARVVEIAHLGRIEEMRQLIENLVTVLNEANIGEHAGDCPAKDKPALIALCDCSHPEQEPLTLKVKALLVVVEEMRNGTT